MSSKAVVQGTFTHILPHTPLTTSPPAYGETLSAELALFNIRVLIAVPGTFNTGLAHPIAGTPMLDYDAARDVLRRLVEKRKYAPNQGGPRKGDGGARGRYPRRGARRRPGYYRVMPLWLFLGGDAVHDALARAEQWRAVAEEWRAVGEGLREDDVQSQHM